MLDITDLNRLIEKSLMLKYFDNGEKLKEIHAIAIKIYKEKSTEFEKKNENFKNKVFLPNEVLQLGRNIERLEAYINDLQPKILQPNSNSRGKAFTETMSQNSIHFKEGMQKNRDERYQSIIDEKNGYVESPLSRK